MLSEMQRERADMLIRRKYKRYFSHKMTYLGLISYAIQNAPEKRLTFIELKNAVAMFVDGDRKDLDSNIRVCLSSNKCFVKVPVNPECPNAKRNFWKLDESKITPKILRRHFSGLRDVFPAFYENIINAIEGKPPSCKLSEAEIKFTGSFSIESLLQRESSASGRPFCASRNSNSLLDLQNRDRGLACKTLDWPNQTDYTNLRALHLPFCFPACSWSQMNGCSGDLKMIHSVSEPPFCTSPESIRPFTQNSVTWAYI